MGIGGQLGIEDEFFGQPSGTLLPELNEAEDLVSLLILTNLGIRVAEDALPLILREKRQNAFLTAAALGNVVFLDQGIFAVKGDGVEVEVEGCTAFKPNLRCGLEPQPHPLRVAARIDPRAVL